MPDTYSETKTLEVCEGADVVVLGGGPGGVAAAIAAARHDMKVMIIEKTAILGGLATGGHISLFEPLCDGNGRKVTGGITEEMFHRSIEYSYNTLPSHWGKGIDRVECQEFAFDGAASTPMGGKNRYYTIFNIPAFILALEESVLREKINILYDTLFCEPIMSDGGCTGVVVENLSGRYVLRCKILVDGTGYSTAFHRAGAETHSIKNHLTFSCIDTRLELMREAVESGKIQKALTRTTIGWKPRMGEAAAPREFYGRNAEDNNAYILASHRIALEYLKANQDGNYAMVSFPTLPQLRFTRNIRGIYEMRPDDVFKHMEDSVGCVSDWRRAGPVYEVPYRCMVDKKFNNMFAVGRNLAAQDDTWDVMRCYPGAMTTGQAAGTAAALAIKEKTAVYDVNIEHLQKELEKDGVMIHI